MALRDKIARNSQRFLEPGEQVQSVFAAQTASSLWILVGYLPFFLVNQYRCIVATDRRILLLDSGRFAMGTPKSIIRVYPRSTRLGPPSGLWYRTNILGEDLRIPRRFHPDMLAADAAGSTSSTPPPPPPPPPPSR